MSIENDERTGLGAVVWLIALSGLARILAAVFVTHGVLVDDAYITLRYARNLALSGSLVYNPGEPVFGVTSPLWALVTTELYALFGDGATWAVTVLNIALWSVVAWIAARAAPPRARLWTALLVLWAPVFVDNQLLGMETPLFALCVLAAARWAFQGRLVPAAACAGWMLVARPEGVLALPLLAWGAVSARGARAAVRALARPWPLFLVLAPGLAWTAVALWAYGSPIPQSMIAKSGWNSDHYGGLTSLEWALLVFPRLTLVPWVDALPRAAARACALAVIALVVWIARANARRGSAWSRGWLAFYALYLAFYLAGRGATEASWYAVPPSLALILAAGPVLPRRLARPAPTWALAALLVLASAALVRLRAPLLRSYVDSYASLAAALDRQSAALGTHPRVAVGEIGVFGFCTRASIVDLGALVSPEVLPLKNRGHSFLGIVRETGCDAFVIRQDALDRNAYPTVGPVWAGERERDFLNRCERLASAGGAHLYRVPAALERVALTRPPRPR